MGRPATSFVKTLSDDDRRWLEETWKQHPNHSVRMRAHAILLSHRRRSVLDLCLIFGVCEPTMRSWLERWETLGRDGLEDESRSGRPPILDEEEQKIVKELIQQSPQQPREVLRQAEARTRKRISRTTLRRLARKFGLRWKRTRRSLKKRRNAKDFAVAMEELKELRQIPGVRLVYFDEASFSLSGAVGYAWQPVGERLHVPLGGGRGTVQVLGIEEEAEGHTRAFLHKGTITGQTVIEVLEQYLKDTGDCKDVRVLVLDNASPHTCAAMRAKEEEWAEQGVILYRLPPYSPELNSIERLWKKVKQQLMPVDAWESLKSLVRSLRQVFSKLGEVTVMPSLLSL